MTAPQHASHPPDPMHPAQVPDAAHAQGPTPVSVPLATSPQDPILSTPAGYPTTVGNDGRIAWALGLIGFIGVPALASLAMGTTMMIVGLMQRKKNPVARVVGTRAAIFGASAVLAVILFFAFMVIGFWLEPEPQSNPSPLLMVMAVFGVYQMFLAPLIGVIMGIVALVRPVGPTKAASILETSGPQRH